MTATTQKIATVAVLLAGLSAPSTMATQAYAIEPISGSITFQGQPKTQLQKSPVGSTFTHAFYANGARYEETYRVKEDRSLELLNRRRLTNR